MNRIFCGFFLVDASGFYLLFIGLIVGECQETLIFATPLMSFFGLRKFEKAGKKMF
jgi:hypothetical protein